MARVAETFHVLPSVAARDLDRDSEQLSITCMALLSYADALAAYRSARSKKDLQGWADSKMMQLVQDNDFDLVGMTIGR